MNLGNPIFLLASWIIFIMMLAEIMKRGKIHKESSRKILLAFSLGLIIAFMFPPIVCEIMGTSSVIAVRIFMISSTMSIPLALWSHKVDHEDYWKNY